MADQTQNYANHARLSPPYHYFVLPVTLVHVLVSLWSAWQTPSVGTVWAVVVAVALAMLVVYARVMVLTVQDRIIRLEMQLRLRTLLPADLQKRIPDLTPRQLVALRFAGDAELPGLVRDVLGGALGTPKEIKLRINDWQGDFLRA
jgi:hypothetical protein